MMFLWCRHSFMLIQCAGAHINFHFPYIQIIAVTVHIWLSSAILRKMRITMNANKTYESPRKSHSNGNSNSNRSNKNRSKHKATDDVIFAVNTIHVGICLNLHSIHYHMRSIYIYIYVYVYKCTLYV